jgi:hypothetical protein
MATLPVEEMGKNLYNLPEPARPLKAELSDSHKTQKIIVATTARIAVQGRNHRPNVVFHG